MPTLRVIFLLGVLFCAGVLSQGQVYLVFRYDDFSADPRGKRDSLRQQIWQAEQSVDKLFAHYHFPYLVGIVPAEAVSNEYPGWYGGAEFSTQQDPEKVQWLRKAVEEGRIEAAQHGFRHQRNTADGHGRGEFRELPYDQQLDQIQRGRLILAEALGGRKPRVFIPPFNGWNNDTARALQAEGFSVLSADRTYYSEPLEGLSLLPATVNVSGLEAMIDQNALPEEGVLVVLYHSVELTPFPDSAGQNLHNMYFPPERWSRLFSKISQMTTVEVTTPLRLIEQGHDLSFARFTKDYEIASIYHFWSKLLPQRYCPGYPLSAAYQTESKSSIKLKYVKRQHAAYLFCCVLAGGLCYLGYWKIRPRDALFPGVVCLTGILLLSVGLEFNSLRCGFQLTATRAFPGLLSAGGLFIAGWRLLRHPVGAKSEFVDYVHTIWTYVLHFFVGPKTTILSHYRAHPRTWVILGVCSVISFWVHFQYRIAGYGEMDACEMGNMALQLHETGTLYDYSYRIRTSVLYIQSLKKALDWGLPPAELPDLMCLINVTAGALLLPGLYYMWRNLADARTVTVTLILLSFAPAFWQSQIYGMPHVPAFLFFVISLILFYEYLHERITRLRTVYYLLSVVFGVLTVGFKADLMLAFGIYFIMLYRKYGCVCRHWVPGVLPLMLPVIFVLTYPQYMYPLLTGFSKFSKDWSGSFPFTLAAVTDSKNLAATLCSVGPVFFFTFIGLMILGIWKKIRMDVFLSVLFWSLPLAAFWGLRMGNSARHMLMAMTAVVFYATLILCRQFKSNWKLGGVLLVLIPLNYYLSPIDLLGRTFRPSTRLLLSRDYHQMYVSCWHSLGRQFAESPADRKIIVGNETSLYMIWETIARQPGFQIVGQPRMFVSLQDGHPRYVRSIMTGSSGLTELEKNTLISDNPDWEIWVLLTGDNNRQFDLKRIHTAGPL